MCGGGPALTPLPLQVCTFSEALAEGAIKMGMPSGLAHRIAAQTLLVSDGGPRGARERGGAVSLPGAVGRETVGPRSPGRDRGAHDDRTRWG